MRDIILISYIIVLSTLIYSRVVFTFFQFLQEKKRQALLALWIKHVAYIKNWIYF